MTTPTGKPILTRRSVWFAIAAPAALVTIFLAAGCGDKTSEDSAVSTEQVLSPNSLTAAESAAGWKLLFDGLSATGWRGYNQESFPTSGWRIEGGTLIAFSGTNQDIVTVESFADFELSVDFLVTDTANSGIFYRVIEKEGEPIWFNAPEYQLLDDTTYIDMGTMDMNKHLTGDNYDLHSATVRPTNPVGEWNTARIVANDAHVEHWLNGVKTVEYELWTPEWEDAVATSKFAEYPAYGRTIRGPIGFQDHGHEVRFRNIKIREI